jgi:hypothetical protein
MGRIVRSIARSIAWWLHGGDPLLEAVIHRNEGSE